LILRGKSDNDILGLLVEKKKATDPVRENNKREASGRGKGVTRKAIKKKTLNPLRQKKEASFVGGMRVSRRGRGNRDRGKPRPALGKRKTGSGKKRRKVDCLAVLQKGKKQKEKKGH